MKMIFVDAGIQTYVRTRIDVKEQREAGQEFILYLPFMKKIKSVNTLWRGELINMKNINYTSEIASAYQFIVNHSYDEELKAFVNEMKHNTDGWLHSDRWSVIYD